MATRRSEAAFKEAKKNLEQGEVGLAAINQIVGIINRQMENLTGAEIRAHSQERWDEMREGAIKVTSKELSDAMSKKGELESGQAAPNNNNPEV